MLVVEEEDAEADERDLRVQVEAAAEADSRQSRPSRSVRATDVGLELVASPSRPRSTSAPTSAPSGTRAPRGRGTPPRDPCLAAMTGNASAAIEPAERDRGLPDPEREPALVRAEPVHDRAPARGVDAGAGGAGEREQPTRARERLRVRRSREASRARPQAERRGRARSPKRSAASPQGSSVRVAPTQAAASSDADLPEREVVLLAEHRRDDRQARCRDRREARLRGVPAASTAHR